MQKGMTRGWGGHNKGVRLVHQADVLIHSELNFYAEVLQQSYQYTQRIKTLQTTVGSLICMN